MKRGEVIAALVAFVVAACASGVADPLISEPIDLPGDDAGTRDASTQTDGSTGDAGTDATVAASNDSLPVGAVAFTFATACPVGFEPYTDAEGRYALGAESDVGTTSSATPLSSLEDRMHSHTVSGNATTSDRGIAGSTVTGGSSNASPDDPSVSATTSADSLGLPYLQMRACRKTGAPNVAAPALPQGSIVPFTTATCPAGFAPYAPANGRFVVGLPVGGTNAMTLGGAAMTSGESFSHAHSYQGNISLGSRNPHLISGSPSFASPGSQSFTIPASNVATTLPFVRLLYCERM